MKSPQDEKQIEDAHALFQSWRQNDRQMATQLEDIRDWMNRASDQVVPHFSQTGDRLTEFREVLVAHFDREDALCGLLATFYDKPCPEVEGMCRQSSGDHSHLLNRLDDMIENLKSVEPPFPSWDSAIDQVTLFFDAIEQHEEYESESIRALMPLLPNDSSRQLTQKQTEQDA